MNAIARLLGSILVMASLPALASAQRVEVQLWSDLPEDSFVVYRGQEVNLSVKATEDSYVTVQATDEDGTVRVLFPNELQRDNFVYGGEEVPIASLRGARPGPIYIEAIAVLSEDYEFRYGEVTPFWNAAWGEFYLDNFLSEDEREFPLELGRGDAIRPASLSDSQSERLSEMVDADYESFEPLVRDFRDQTHDAVSREDWARSYVDVYIADEDDLGSSRDTYGRPRYEYASYGNYDPPQFDYEVALTGYGTWFDYHGVRSWRPPSTYAGWRPFTSGYWTETSYGMHWVGYEPFAWVTYHYGSWWYEAGHGWIWIPDWRDYRWTPANCRWQTEGDYFMWYPAPPPREVAIQLNIDVDLDINIHLDRAVIVRKENFLRPNISEVLEPVERIHNVLKGVRPKFLPEPPGARAIEKLVGKALPQMKLQETNKPAMEGRAQVVIRKPVEMKEPPKVFRDLDAKVKKDVQAGKVQGKPAGKPADKPGAGPSADGRPTRPKINAPQGRAAAGPGDKVKPVTPPPGSKVGEGKPRPSLPPPTTRPGKPAGNTAPRADKQAPPRGAGRPAPKVDSDAKPAKPSGEGRTPPINPGQPPASDSRPKPGKPQDDERPTPPADSRPKPGKPADDDRATPPADSRPKPGKPGKPADDERATPPADSRPKPGKPGKPADDERTTPPADSRSKPGKPGKGEERATPPAERTPPNAGKPKGEDATPPADARKPAQPRATPGGKPPAADEPAGKADREKAKAKPAEGKGGKDAKDAKDDEEKTPEEKKKEEEEEAAKKKAAGKPGSR